MIKFRLNEILKEREICGAKFARKIGMPYSTFLKVKNAKGQGVRLEYIEKFCRALKCTPDDLFEIVDEKSKI